MNKNTYLCKMFEPKDIAMLIKFLSEKRLKKELNIKDLEYSDIDSYEFSPNRYRGAGFKCGFKIVFKIKQTVNREELIEKVDAVIEESILNKFHIHDASDIQDCERFPSFEIVSSKFLSKTKYNVGKRSNINYLSLEIKIHEMRDNDNIVFKVKNAIRNIKLTQLRINI